MYAIPNFAFPPCPLAPFAASSHLAAYMNAPSHANQRRVARVVTHPPTHLRLPSPVPVSSSVCPRLFRRMGAAMSLAGKAMGKMGMPVKPSLLTDKIYEQSFSKIKNFKEFHTAYLDACNKFNSIMLGQHYEAPVQDKIKGYYEEWDKESDTEKKKQFLIDQLAKDVKISRTDHSFVMTGLVVPPAAMVLKKTGEKVPQVKKFRLDLVPDWLFVPSVTLVALFGVKAVNQKTASIA